MAKHTITVQANGMTYKVETDANTFMIGGVEFKFSSPAAPTGSMRGILIKRLTAGVFQCTTCGLKPPAELHTAQGVFWWVPGPHNAPCGQPCLGAGLEAPFQGHRGDGKCSDPECKVEAPKKIKHYEKAHLPTWVSEILLPMIKST